MAGELASELEADARRPGKTPVSCWGWKTRLLRAPIPWPPGSTTRPASSAEGMQRAAAVALSPRPERWPAKGFVTREYISGNIARGIKPHLGIDIAGPLDAPVTAPRPPESWTRTGTDDFLGNFVEIRHGLGYLTVYGHCSRIAVGQGRSGRGGPGRGLHGRKRPGHRRRICISRSGTRVKRWTRARSWRVIRSELTGYGDTEDLNRQEEPDCSGWS